MILFKMSWRNVWRNKWRTVLTIGAICFGVSLMVWGFCLTDGSHEQIIRASVEAFSGHLQINRRGYHDDQRLRLGFVPDSSLYGLIESHKPAVTDYSARITTFGLISVGETSFAGMLLGIEPEAEARFIHWDRKLEQGEYLDPADEYGALVGTDMAGNLGVSLGDTIIIVTQDYYGALTGGFRVVRGIFRSYAAELDRSAVLINLASAQHLLSMDKRVNTLVLMASNNEDVDPLKESLVSSLTDRDMEIKTWYEILPDLVQFVELDSFFGALTEMILVLVIGFMVLNTFLMSVMERIREFGVMRSLGASPGRVVVTIVLEALLLTAVGLLIGNLIGLTASWINSIYPLDFSGMGEEVYKEYGMDPRIYALINLKTVLVPNLLIIGVVILALIYPAIRASRIKPVEALARR
ncbi:ABC transporter permease [Gemmatimonadota bacterium]